jgi:SAM-dependent methyltransferase
MEDLNFADLDARLKETPPELVGMYPLGGGGLLEAPYRHYFESRHFRTMVRMTKSMHVLELGSGNGRWALALAPLVQSYTGVDVTPRAVEIARDAVSFHKIDNCTFYEASILDFKAKDKFYDLIYFSGVSQYLHDKQLTNVLENLVPAMAKNAVIVDRSTINYGRREILERPGYFSVLRTPEEVQKLLAEHEFELTYMKRSYRFLRGARLLQRPRLSNVMLRVMNATRPLSLYCMLSASFIADYLRPKPSGEGNWDHVFLRFDRINR